ncbi:MAG: DUF3575 domain-containing protein [Bacteroidia bacterium]|nr:DUF3575 domain-containing protein [Bacteroidia bacterium]
MLIFRRENKYDGAFCLTLLFLILLQISYKAQTNTKKLVLSTSLFEFIPDIKLNTSNYNLGVEFRLSNLVSLSTNFGMVKSVGTPQGFFVIPSIKTEGFKAQVEFRIYHNRLHEKQLRGFHFGPQFVYKFTQTTREETVLDYVDNNPYPNSQHYKLNTYTVNRFVTKLNLKLGYQFLIRGGLVIDPSLGFGAQYISSKADNRLGNNAANDEPWGKLFDTGSDFYPNLSFQLKAGWAF